MKRIIAVIRPFKLDDVCDALATIGIRGMTVTEVTGFEQRKGHFQIYRGHAYVSDFIPRIKIEVVISDERLDDAITVVVRGARTGKDGDGKIFVLDVSEAIRIRTGEMGDDACNPPTYGKLSAS